MANFTGKLYGNALLHLARKRADLLSDVIDVTLHTVTYVPNQDTQLWVSDLTNELPTANGYTAGGNPLVNKTVTYDAATKTVIFDADDIAILNSTITWRVAVFSDRTPATAATQPLLAYALGDADTVSTGGTTTITMPATGIMRFTAN
ncbi:MAG: hypothetical protein ACR2M1_12395 [Gemmatimonadaceae bacterium]